MANGATAARLPFSEPPSGPAITQPADKPAPNEIERSIGEATASAACAFARALLERQTSWLSPETRLASGTRVAALYTLQQSTLGQIDFAFVARQQGKRVLRQYFDAGFFQHYSVEQSDAVLDVYIDEVLAILGKVATFERAMAN
jgi:hypothetical protein